MSSIKLLSLSIIYFILFALIYFNDYIKLILFVLFFGLKKSDIEDREYVRDIDFMG
jgi:hypothetical protein